MQLPLHAYTLSLNMAPGTPLNMAPYNPSQATLCDCDDAK